MDFICTITEQAHTDLVPLIERSIDMSFRANNETRAIHVSYILITARRMY
jgi:hypothetical protein